jgi:hypothetical protein
MKIKHVSKIVSIYMLISSIMCIYFLIILLFSVEVTTSNIYFMLIFAIIMISLTIFNNIGLLKARGHDGLSDKFIINAIIFGLQVFSVVTDGFYYKYVQGSNLNVFWVFENGSNHVQRGAYWDIMIFDFSLKFEPADDVLIGFNLIALVGMLVSIYCLYKKNRSS